MNIALLGECMIELNGKPFGEMWQTYGGDSLNTATYLARLTHPEVAKVYYLTAIGTDALSQGMLTRWQDDGIQTDMVLRDQHHQPGAYLIQLDAQGERTFLYWRNDSAARYLLQHPHWSYIKKSLQQFEHLYLSGISLAILPAKDREKLIQCLVEYAQQGGKICFDGNYRPALWQNQNETQQCYQQLFPHTQLALMTFDDEQALWGECSPTQSITRLQQAGVKEIVIKTGANGAIYANAQEKITVPTVAIENIIDTTAAGDAFNAGFLNGYLQQYPPQHCCQQGNQLAGIVIQHQGAIIPKTYCRLS